MSVESCSVNTLYTLGWIFLTILLGGRLPIPNDRCSRLRCRHRTLRSSNVRFSVWRQGTGVGRASVHPIFKSVATALVSVELCPRPLDGFTVHSPVASPFFTPNRFSLTNRFGSTGRSPIMYDLDSHHLCLGSILPTTAYPQTDRTTWPFLQARLLDPSGSPSHLP